MEYYSSIISILAILASFFAIYLNFIKEKKNEIFIRKLKFYEELIDHFNMKFFQEDFSFGKNTTKLYNKSFIFVDDKVIKSLNEYYAICKNRNKVPNLKLKPWFAKFLTNCRKDLGFSKRINPKDYNAPFSK